MKLENRTTGLVEIEASDSTRFASLATLIKTARMQKAKDVHLLFPLQGALSAHFFPHWGNGDLLFHYYHQRAVTEQDIIF